MIEDGFLNVSFMLASLMTLVFLNRRNHLDDEGYLSDSDEELEDNEIPIDRDCTAAVDKRMQIYSTLLVNMENAKEADFDRMPTFNEMMADTTKRRCYSADDIDALCLIPDQRIKSVFDEALRELVAMDNEEKSIGGISTVTSTDTMRSWDKLG